MREQFVHTISEVMKLDERVVLLLGDIGVYGFRDLFKEYPDRCINVGICEQSMISMAAGLSMAGLIPIIHSIAPFVVERCYEQIKDDFGYQQLGGTIISVGASSDYKNLGYTHYCPADVAILSQIPDIQIFVPGTGKEFQTLFKKTYGNGKLKYFRLSAKENKESQKVKVGHGVCLKTSNTDFRVIAIGNTLDITLLATQDLDVSVTYETMVDNFKDRKAFYVEPYYSENFGMSVPKQYEPFDFDVLVLRDKILKWIQ